MVAPPQIAGSSSGESTLQTSSAAGAARLTLEAMRLGVVPRSALDAYTVGREAEMSAVEADLTDAADHGGALRAFMGGYGTGKTHLLELIGQRALQRGFLVAHVVLNPDETAPSHPKRVYRELVRSLQYPDRASIDQSLSDQPNAAPQPGRGRSLGPLFRRVLDCPDALDALQVDRHTRPREILDEGAHLYLTSALRYFRELTAGGADLGVDERDYGLTLLFDWLEGHPTISNVEIDDSLRHMVGRQGRIYSMKDYRPWSRIYGYLLSGLSALARMVGYTGLAVLVDEAEFYSLLSSQNRDYARVLFKALAWASVGHDADILPFDRARLDVGGMGILKELPPQYRPAGPGAGAGVYTVFAMTPNEEGAEALGEAVSAAVTTELSTLHLDDYRRLVDCVCAHYQRARPGADIDPRMIDGLGKVVAGLLGSGYVDNPRQAMKFIVEFLDISRFRPADMKRVLADLRSMYA